jgi:hypothetical protein
LREAPTRILNFFKMLILCVLAGGLIGALDSLAVYVWNYGDEYALQTLLLEGISLGIVLGPILGLIIYYAMFGGHLSFSDFGLATLATAIGGALCSLGLGRFLGEWSWLCTPAIMVAAAAIVKMRRLSHLKIG